jgi:hypothetical protein
MQRRSKWLAGAVVLAFAAKLSAQVADSTAPKKIHQPERLFRSRDLLTLTIKAPFKTIFKNRDTLETQAIPGVIIVDGPEGDPKPIPVTFATRGHFRLKRSTCSFPPLKVTFDKEASKGTIFQGQSGIKLGTHCQSGSYYDQDVLLEEAIYRAYNVLTNFSHRTRLAKITYIDTEEKDSTKVISRHGMFLEHDNEVAKRNGGKLLMETGGHLSDMEPGLLDLVSVFEYMIGNTDWSVYAIHNIRLVEMTDQGGYLFPIAYDFDFSGLIDAPYAIPDERLPIRRVRQRLFRGTCRKIEEITPTLQLFSSKRDSLEAVFTSIDGLEPKRLKDVKEYLKDFFDEIKEPKKFERELEYACARGR